MQKIVRPVAAAMGVGLLVVPALGCAHVNRSEMQTELARLETDLRTEYRAADGELGNRIDGVDSRVDRVEVHLADLDARTATLENDLQALATDVGATVQRLENAIAFNAPVYFDYDSDQVRENDRPVLDRFAEVVRGYYPESLITVEGFTDPAGPAEYNRVLGERRAHSVVQVLVEAGVEPQRLRAVSYGEDVQRQVVPGAQGPDEGLANRRVTLVIETSNADWDVTDAEQPVDTELTNDEDTAEEPTEVIETITS